MSFFDELGAPAKVEEKFEIVEGKFSCQRDDCWESAYEAKYFEDVKLLTWRCPDGHLSKILEFDL